MLKCGVLLFTPRRPRGCRTAMRGSPCSVHGSLTNCVGVGLALLFEVSTIVRSQNARPLIRPALAPVVVTCATILLLLASAARTLVNRAGALSAANRARSSPFCAPEKSPAFGQSPRTRPFDISDHANQV